MKPLLAIKMAKKMTKKELQENLLVLKKELDEQANYTNQLLNRLSIA